MNVAGSFQIWVYLPLLMNGCVLLFFNYFIYWFIRVDKNFTVLELTFLTALVRMLILFYVLEVRAHTQA